MTRAGSLEDAFKRRSDVKVIEAHRELSISLEKFKTSLLESAAAGKASASSLWGVWVNRAECICRDVLDQVVRFMEESGASQQEDLRGPQKVSLDGVVQ
jgi:hypothetical protein